jgi:hypothetical protein
MGRVGPEVTRVLGEWVYGVAKPVIDDRPQDIPSLTTNAIQRNWRTPATFAMCPDACSPDALIEYRGRLTFGTVFALDASGQSRTTIAGNGRRLFERYLQLVPKRHQGVTNVTIENDKFVHESVRSYFSLQGALKVHCRLLNVPLGESIDDYA